MAKIRIKGTPMRAEVFETLKRVLRARKLTYADLAQRLGTSEPTIKRIFAARDDKLSRIEEICDALDLPLEDLIAQAKRTEVKPLILSDTVERHLAEDPALFHFFLLLRDGLSATEIQTLFDLSTDRIFRLGQKLDRLGLAQLHEAGRIRLVLDQPIQFRRDGPLHRMLLTLNLDFMRETFFAPDTPESGFLTQSRHISDTTARHMMRELRKLNREFSDMARQDQLTLPAADLKTYKLTLAWGPVTFSRLMQFDPEDQPQS